MRILKISFSNIHNLKGGPHIISFDQAPLDTAGIFAILGPTGSGKSTILDVITLALFNSIPRYSKAISKREMTILGSVITHHAKEASASIDYEMNGHRYTSSWRISKTRTGTLKDYEMYLQDEGGAYMDLKKSEIPAKNEEIIGLKYDQFIKSIILSQGAFSKFLKANKNERGQLLENITGTTIYRKIGQQAYFKYKDIQKSVELEIQKLGEIIVLSEEELTETREVIEKTNKQKAAVDKEIAKLHKIRQVKTDRKHLEEELVRKEVDRQELQKEIIQFQPLLQNLRIHEKITPLRGDLATYFDAKTNKKVVEKKLISYREVIDRTERGLSEVIKEMGVILKKQVDHSNFKTEMKSFEKEVHRMDTELNNHKIKGQEERSRINEIMSDYSIKLGDKISAKEAISQIEAHQKELNQILDRSELNLDSNLEASRQKLKTDHEILTKITSLKENLLIKNDTAERVQLEKAKSQETEKQILQLVPLIEKSEQNTASLEKVGELLARRKEDALKIARLEEFRPQLKVGEPCPLCGSIEHPYTAHLPIDEQPIIDKQISDNKEALRKAQKELLELKNQHVQAQTSFKHMKVNLGELEKNLKELTQIIHDSKASLKGKVVVDEKSISADITQLSKKVDLLERAISALQMLKTNRNLYKAYVSLDQTTRAYNQLKSEREKKFNGDDPASISQVLQDRYQDLFNLKTENAKALEIESVHLKNLEDILVKTQKNLLPRMAALGFSDIDEISQHLLSEERHQEVKAMHEELTKKETANNTRLTSLKQSINKQVKADTSPEVSLEDILGQLEEKEMSRDRLSSNLGENLARIKQDEELRARRKKKEIDIGRLSDQMDRWSLLNNLIGDATGNKFANFAQGLTLQNLLVFANQRLKDLSDRYLLDMPGEDGSLRIIDQYQGNTERAVSTLSGGETFLISLSLALSMSDMASKHVSLDSLFIDEGFGTLDQETLDLALDTLEKLQTESQKTVGVISHVEALKERINVQIRLEKNAQGHSKLEIVG